MGGQVQDVRFDVAAAVGTTARVAGRVFDPEPGSPPGPVLVCLPGGTYTHRYFDLEVPGHDGYSAARHWAAAGATVVALDQFGTGESTRPDDVEVGLDLQAAAAAAAVDAFRTERHDLEERPWIGVGHSMGGYVAMVQQASHRSYDAVAILGTTNIHVAPLDLPEALREAAAGGAVVRRELVGQMLASFPERFVEPDRTPLIHWFHLADVDPEVLAADLATTATVVPRLAAAESTVPGITADAAAAIDVPVFLAYGEVDVSPAPHAEPAAFAASHDVTLLVLAGAGHCHHMAPVRTVLWDRLIGWWQSVLP
jgi:pimeloyl-ACP methyl ester carboxylesterase